jgi:hypothetical protein
MPEQSRLTAFTSPASVAVHDDGNVPWERGLGHVREGLHRADL